MFEITVAGLIFATAVICVAFLLLGSRDAQIVIPLPTAAATDAVVTAGAPGGAEAIAVTKTTVQNVIATLARPNVYSRDIMVERFWNGGNAVSNFNVAIFNKSALLKTTSGGTEKNVIVTENATYIWYAGDREPFVYSGEASSDEFSMILTYEDILSLDKSEILDAAFVTTNGVPEISVMYATGELGYVTECRVSVELGLLVEAEVYDGDTLIYRMSASEANLDEPTAQFRLPNGEIAE
jgi:hypothetical protein